MPWRGVYAESGFPPVAQPRLSLIEGNTNSFLLAPDHVAMMTDAATENVERDLMRYAHRTCDLKRGTTFGNVANRAFDTAAVELNRSGFEDALSGYGASFVHSASLR
jgi:hypothetical protein